MAGLPKELIAFPGGSGAEVAPGDDVLSSVLRSIRLSGSLQFCVLPSGAWHTDAAPSLANMAGASGIIPFHVVAEGGCWLKMEGHDAVLAAGDVVAFPFGSGHQLGAGSGGRLVTPVRDLPPKPWREIPVLRYGPAPHGMRLLCGYLKCDAISFRPLRDALPAFIHVRTRGTDTAPWLRAAVEQMVSEVDRPRAGGASVLERLSEIVFIELLRHQVIAARPGASGWLAALADPALGRCLTLIHDNPRRDWSVPALSSASGVSRSTLAERFEDVLGTSPMRYLREWRLCLARVALATTGKPLTTIAVEAGYGTEAAFNRAFARAYGVPPASWRKAAQQAQG